MKNQIVTTGLILSRTNYQEADRILTVLTPDQGKVSVIAKGVRRPRSKMAGGIELFCESEITLLPSRSEIKTLISSRMSRHFGNIVKDVNRTMLGYEILKRVNRVTEDVVDEEYYNLILSSLAGLDDLALDINLVKLWFELHLLDISGHAPNLVTDNEGAQLQKDAEYAFDYDVMAFSKSSVTPYNANHIRLLRLARTLAEPMPFKQLQGSDQSLPEALKLTDNMLKMSLRL